MWKSYLIRHLILLIILIAKRCLLRFRWVATEEVHMGEGWGKNPLPCPYIRTSTPKSLVYKMSRMHHATDLKKFSSTCFRKINAMATMKFFWIRFFFTYQLKHFFIFSNTPSPSQRTWQYSLMYDVSKNTAPDNISKLFSRISRASTSEHFYTKESRLNVKRNAFSRVGVKIWNGIPQILKERPKKAFITKRNATRFPWNWRLLYWCGYDHRENEKVILLSFIFILFYF